MNIIAHFPHECKNPKLNINNTLEMHYKQIRYVPDMQQYFNIKIL